MLETQRFLTMVLTSHGSLPRRHTTVCARMFQTNGLETGSSAGRHMFHIPTYLTNSRTIPRSAFPSNFLRCGGILRVHARTMLSSCADLEGSMTGKSIPL